jgi:hypothetical protein
MSKCFGPGLILWCELSNGKGNKLSLTFREERRLRVFENVVLRRIFVPKRDEVTGEWRKLYDEELNDLYCTSNSVRVIKSRRIRWPGL